MRNQDLILAARKANVITRFRNTIGLPGTMAVRLLPEPTPPMTVWALPPLWSMAFWLRRCGDRH